MASSDNGGRVLVWDLRKRERIGLLEHGHLTTAVAFSGDGRWLASSDWDRTVRAWSAVELRPKKVLSDARHRAAWLAFAPRRRGLVTADEEGILRIYRLPDFTLAREIATGNAIEQIAFSRSGHVLLTAHRDGQVAIWRTH